MINKKKIIVLCVVVLFLIGILALVLSIPKKEGDSNTDKVEKTEVTKTKLLDIDFETINHITLTSDDEDFTFKKVNDEFIYAQDASIALRQSKIITLISRVCDIGYIEKIDDITSYGDFGIDDNSPRCNFECNLGTVEYIMGDKVASSDMYYFKTNLSDTIYLVLPEDINVIFAEFNSYRLFVGANIDLDNLNEIVLANKNGKMTFVKAQSDKYNANSYTWMDKDLNIYARDEEITNHLITPFKNFDLKNVVSDKGDFTNYGITKENYVTYKDTKGKYETVYYSSIKDNGYYIAFEGKNTIYKQAQGAVPFGDIKKIDILVRNLYLTKRENLKTIEATGDINFKVEFKSGDIFVDGKKAKSEIDESSIFSNLFSLFADDINTISSGEVVLKITYTLNDGAVKVLEFSNDGERYYNVSINSKPTYKILKSKLFDMKDRIDDLLK